MSIKRRVIEQSIEMAKKRLKEIDYILDANPVSDIMRLEKETITEAKELIKQNKVQKSLELVTNAQKKRSKLFKLAEKQQKSIELTNEKVKLQMELGELNRELYYLNARNKS